jgi:hypothetical protein
VIADGERYLGTRRGGLVRPGGLYVVDDMLPQPNGPDDHPPKVARFVEALAARPDFHITHLRWSTGLILAARKR